MSITYIDAYAIGDPDFPSVSLLLHLNGTNGSTDFTGADTSSLPKTVTGVGSAQISNAEARFHQSLLLNDANTYTNYLTTPDNAGFQFGTGDFTVEAWFYLISKPRGVAAIISSGSSLYNANGGYLVVDGSNRIQFGLPGAAFSGGTISTGQWYHVAGTRSGTTTRIFINGTLEATGTGDSSSYNFSKDNLLIGRNGWDSSGSQGFHGYIDEVRITKGVARYTASFTAPTAPAAPFPDAEVGIVTSGLILYLDAGDTASYPGSGATWTDLSGNGNNATLVGGVGYNFANQGSLTFDGNNDFASYSFTNPFAETVIVWAKSATTNWNTNCWISSSRAENGHLIHPVQGQKTVQFYMGESTGPNQIIGTGTPNNIMIPHMYSYTESGTDLHIAYIDATEVARSTFSLTFGSSRSTTPSSQTTYLGADAALQLNRYGNGNIYSCLRYNRALTATEITQNYNALKGRYGL
jgi:hypothetical protein